MPTATLEKPPVQPGEMQVLVPPGSVAAQPQPEPQRVVHEAPPHFRAILGKKVGATQIFNAQGHVIPVTIVEAGPCPIVKVRTPENDGYAAIQLGFETAARKRFPKAYLGQFKSCGALAMRFLREFRVSRTDGLEVGQVVDLKERFSPGDYIDVQGVSKGKGFAGGMKRHHFRGGPASHGASDKERAPGSLASRRSLGRVLPGQRMAGHMGARTVTTQKIEVIQVEPDRHWIYLRGSVPGPQGSLVTLVETVKNLKRRRMPALLKAPAAQKGGKTAAKTVVKPVAKSEKK